MSASIMWEPIKTDYKSLYVLAPATFIDKIERAFGTFPITLKHGDIPKLVGMSAMYEGDSNPYEEIIILLEKYPNGIKIWAEY